ncbi:hypothetical protein UlMin_021434 [Ulmus minor]
MGGGTMPIDLPITRLNPSSSLLPTPSSSLPNLHRPISSTHASTVHPSCSCNNKASRNLEAVNLKEDNKPNGTFFNSVLGSVPSQSEVETAISLLQNFIEQVKGSELKWLEGPVPRILVSYGIRKVYDAFQLLQIDPSVKRLVVSLSSDKAIWEAIMNNESVQKLREPSRSGESRRQIGTTEGAELAASIMDWLWNVTKAKWVELVEKFQSLAKIFESSQNEKGRWKTARERNEELGDKIRSSLFLSIVILLIVVVSRAQEVP